MLAMSYTERQIDDDACRKVLSLMPPEICTKGYARTDWERWLPHSSPFRLLAKSVFAVLVAVHGHSAVFWLDE